jgi:hypothetical protein
MSATTYTIPYTGELTTCTCWCGIHLAIPASLYDSAQRNHSQNIYCPLGHTFVFKGETEEQKLKRLLNAERDRTAALRGERDGLENRLRSTKGVVTKLRKRAIAGTCPFGCRRTFPDLSAHVITKHPDEHLEGEDS